MTKRILLLGLALGLLSLSSGCVSTALKSGYREFKQFSTSFLPYEADGSRWEVQYSALRIERISDEAINGRTPPELMSRLGPLASGEVADAGMFRSVNGTADDQVLIVRGEILHYDSGGMGATRTVGFGESRMVVIRTTFIDGASGRVLARANLVSKAESALRNWADLLSRGYGAAIVKYLKETQGYTKLAE